MASPVIVSCHRCGQTFGPSHANDGTRVRCTHCRCGVTVVRNSENHPRSKTGLNTTPYVARQSTRKSLSQPTPIRHTLATDLNRANRAIVSYRERKLTDQRQRSNAERPLDVQMPTTTVPCELCTQLNYKDHGRFSIAEFEVTVIVHSGKVLCCRSHMIELRTLHLIIRARPLEIRANPTLGGRGIGNVPTRIVETE